MAEHVPLPAAAHPARSRSRAARPVDRRGGPAPAQPSGPAGDLYVQPTPAVAPLAVPLAHRLPTGFRLMPLKPGLMDETCDLILSLTRQGVLPRRPPRPEETPPGYLVEGYAAAHQAAFDVADIEVELCVARHWSEALHRGCPVLEVRVLPPRVWSTPRLVDLRRLRAELSRSDPTLFGAVIQALRTALAPYAPVFTAEDAWLGEAHILFGEHWEEQTEETITEAHRAELSNIAPRDLMRWAERQGMPHPYGLGRKYPWSLWMASGEVQDRLLETLRGHAHPGLRAAGALLDVIGQWPSCWVYPREWAARGMHPGLIHVVTCQASPERDPVLEVFRDVSDLMGMPDEAEIEPLQVFGVQDRASHEEVLAYVRAVGVVQRQVAEVWALLSA